METLIGSMYFSALDVPNIRVRKPAWFALPPPMLVFGVILATYFAVTGGVIYDIINEPPSIGSTTDANGNSRPVAFMPYRINGQYIMEGLAASFMFTLGGMGLILLEIAGSPSMAKLNRLLMTGIGFVCVLVAFGATRVFMRIKLPGYLLN